MTIITDIVNAIAWIELHPVVGTAITGSVCYTIFEISRAIYRTFTRTSHHINPTFWTFGKKFRVTAVHKYLPSEDSTSGYEQIQHSRPDQWKNLITIKSNWFNLHHTVIPVSKEDSLTVVISRDGKENEKYINFNK